MLTHPFDRRKAQDLEYFEKGGVERRSGPWDRRSNRDRRRLWSDRRVFNNPSYDGPERRSGTDRRSGRDRRRSQIHQPLQGKPNVETALDQLRKNYIESRFATVSQGRKESNTMQFDGRSVKFKIKPASYPSIKIYYKEQQDNSLETEVAFPKEFWMDLASACKEVTGKMDAFSSQSIAAGLNLMSQTIMAEIAAEEKRLRNKEAYEAFADFVMEVNSRSDLDKVHKGQMIHDEAYRLRLQP